VDDQFLRLRTADVAWNEIDGEAVILDLRASEYLAVNRSGTVLLEKLANGSTLSGLTAALRERFALDESDALRDAEAFIATLRARRLLAEAPELSSGTTA
jgi:hypothetical protein